MALLGASFDVVEAIRALAAENEALKARIEQLEAAQSAQSETQAGPAPEAQPAQRRSKAK